MQPHDKAAWLADRDHRDALFLGDGLNDGAAGAGALASGTPNADRPLSAAPSDFYLTEPGLAPVACALSAARELCAATGHARVVAGACSVVAALLAAAGLVAPLMVAAAMPLAGLAIAGAALLAVSPAIDRRRGATTTHMDVGRAGRAGQPGAVATAHS
jgi:P-type Cu2+ transporter